MDRRNIFLFLILAALCCMAREVIGGIEWPSNLSDGDKEAILTLARETGIEEPVRVCDRHCHPRIRDFLVVESAAKELGHLKSWLELTIYPEDYRPDDPEDYRPDDGSITLRAGRWATQKSKLYQREEWIIEDDGWRLCVGFSRDVPFDVPFKDAELLVLAIRHDELINRLPAQLDPLNPNPSYIFPEIDPGSITRILRSRGLRTYDVYTGIEMGEVFTIQIMNGKAELLRRSGWIE
jgi:hypothetical protein